MKCAFDTGAVIFTKDADAVNYILQIKFRDVLRNNVDFTVEETGFRRPAQMHQQLERVAARVLLRPTDDELLGIVIQSALMKRRGIHGVEQLVQPGQLHFDKMG